MPITATTSPSGLRRRPLSLLLLAALLFWSCPHGAARAADSPAAAGAKFASVADYARCVDHDELDASDCLRALDVYVNAQPGQAFAAGKAVRARTAHWAAIPFFAKAFAGRASGRDASASCADPDVAMALVAAFDLPSSHTVVLAPARAILDRCWNETRAELLAAVSKASPGAALVQNLCPILAQKRQSSAACQANATPAAATPAPAGLPWKQLDPRTITVEDAVKVFKGPEGRSIALVKVKAPADATLIKFEGFRGPWNGRVIQHRESPAASGFDYWTQVAGAPWVSVVARGDGWLSYEVYPSGDLGPFAVSYDEQASRKTRGKSLLEQFARQK